MRKRELILEKGQEGKRRNFQLRPDDVDYEDVLQRKQEIEVDFESELTAEAIRGEKRFHQRAQKKLRVRESKNNRRMN